MIMGEVVSLDRYRNQRFDNYTEEMSDSMVPVEFAVGFSDRSTCLEKIEQYGIRDITAYRLTEQPNTVLHLIGVCDAIWLNKKILEREDIGDEEIAQRIDLIQMLENANFGLMDSLWRSFTRKAEIQL